MCTPQDEGQPQSKRGALRWYDAQNEELRRQQDRWDQPGGWWLGRTAAAVEWRTGGVRGWLCWVFLRLDEHEASCRWRRLVEAVARS